jgi:hypothetical protein
VLPTANNWDKNFEKAGTGIFIQFYIGWDRSNLTGTGILALRIWPYNNMNQ